MSKYIRMHQVEAEPMTRGDYNTFRGWTIPANENPADEGYKVTYPDGYVSWCPKAQFDEAAIRCTVYGDPDAPKHTVTFAYAIAQCRYHGRKIRRLNWNGDGQFVRYETVLVFEDGKLHINEENAGTAKDSECFVFHSKNRVTGETGIQVGWLASQGDMKSEDWVIDD